MEISNLKIFKLDYSGSFDEISIENAQIIDFFTLIDILAIYVPIQKRMYIWVGKNATQSLRSYIPDVRMRFSEKLPELKILRNITIESGSEPSDFFQFINFNWDQLKAHIKEQEVKLEPIIREITSSKRKLADAVKQEDYGEGIKISENIIQLAKEINDKALEKEQEDLIKDLKEKSKIKSSVENVEGEAHEIKIKFDTLIKTNKPEDIVEAHSIVEQFKKKYQESVDLTKIHTPNDLITKDKNIWFSFTREQQEISKEINQLKENLNRAMEKLEITNVEVTMTRAKDLLLRTVDEEIKKEWSEIDSRYLDWKRKNVTIAKIEESIEESLKLKDNFQFEEAISKLESTIELIQDKEIIEYSKKLQEMRNEILQAEEDYIKIRERIAVLDERIKENRKNNLLDSALINCKNLINLAETIKKPDIVLEFSQKLEEIQDELDDIKAMAEQEQLRLMKQAKDLDDVIEIDKANVLPLVEEFSTRDILGDLSDNIDDMLDQIGNLLSEHRVEVKNEISNKAILTSASGDVVELEQSIEVQKEEEKEEVMQLNVQSGVVNPFDDAIESAIITDIIPYNFEIMEVQLNGEPVKRLPDKSLVKGGLELKWELENIPPKEKIDINYNLRRRISRSIIFILKGMLKIIKTHSELHNLELEGFYEARLPFKNSYGTAIEGVIIEDIIPLYYLHFIKEPTQQLPAQISKSEHGELIQWNVGTLQTETLNYQYRLLELYLLEELKIDINELSKTGIDFMTKGDLTESINIYDKIINKLEDFNK